MIYELSDVLLIRSLSVSVSVSVPPRLCQWSVWLALTCYVNFPNHFLPPSEIKQLPVKSFKNLPEQRSFIRQTMGPGHCDAMVASLAGALMELVLFLIGHPPMPARADHLKRRLSSIKRLENFRGWFLEGDLRGFFLSCFQFRCPLSPAWVLQTFAGYKQSPTHEHRHTHSHKHRQAGHTGQSRKKPVVVGARKHQQVSHKNHFKCHITMLREPGQLPSNSYREIEISASPSQRRTNV